MKLTSKEGLQLGREEHIHGPAAARLGGLHVRHLRTQALWPAELLPGCLQELMVLRDWIGDIACQAKSTDAQHIAEVLLGAAHTVCMSSADRQARRAHVDLVDIRALLQRSRTLSLLCCACCARDSKTLGAHLPVHLDGDKASIQHVCHALALKALALHDVAPEHLSQSTPGQIRHF